MNGSEVEIMPPVFSEDERAVLGILAGAQGAGAAVSIGAIRERTAMSYRAVTMAVEGLRTAHRMPIGSSRLKPNGYYIIKTAAELEATVRPLRNQALAMLYVVSSLLGRRARRVRELLGQLEFELRTGTAAEEPCMARVAGTDSTVPLHREDSEPCFHCKKLGRCGCAACAPGWSPAENLRPCASCLGTGRVAWWRGGAGQISGDEASQTGCNSSSKSRSWG